MKVVGITTLLVVLPVLVAHVAPAAAQTPPTTAQLRVTPVAPHAVPLAVAGVVALAAGITLYALPMEQTDPGSHWHGGVLLDDSARSAMRFGTLDGRHAAATVSDLAMISTMLLAATDGVGVPLLQRDVNLSWQAGLAYSLSLGVTLSLGELFKRAVGRERPYEQNCAADPTAPGCGTPDAYASFYSLHTSVAFTSAGFSCAMHLSRSLYGDGLADGASCATSLALAALTGVMRIAADQHYLSDVLVGGLVGFAIGYLVPLWLVPQRPTAGHRSGGVSASVVPVIQPAPGGGTFELTVAGQF